MDEAPYIIVGFTGGGTSWNDHRNAIHVEVITVGTGFDRTERHFPNAVGSLGHLSALAVARNIAAAEAHGFRLRGENAERDVPVRGNFRRHNLRPLRDPALRVCGRR